MTVPDDEPSSSRSWVDAGLDANALALLRSQLPATQLWSLLLDVVAQRAAVRTPSDLMRQWDADRFVAPSYIDQRTLNELDRELLAAAEQFESVELAPLAPLAACAAVAPTSQNRVVATTRGAEVVSDPTNVLALESAQRLRKDPAKVVKLATSHRCVRAQEVPPVPGYAAHFRMFCMTTAGREQQDHALTVDAFVEHMRVHLQALDRLEQHGYAFPDRRTKLLSTPACEPLAQRIAARISDLEVAHERLAHPYYNNGLRFMMSARARNDQHIPLIDGGAFDWVAQLAANRKLVFIASAIGSQVAAYLYRDLPTGASSKD
jgi:hypothetical protein